MVPFLSDLFSSDIAWSTAQMLSEVILFFDPTVSGVGSKLISFQITPMGSKAPMQHVLELWMVEGDGNDLYFSS